MSDITKRLKYYREQKGITQQELAKKCGLPQSHISRIERGGVDLRLSNLEEIAKLLDMEVVLVPRSSASVIESLINKNKGDLGKPAWLPDEEEQ